MFNKYILFITALVLLILSVIILPFDDSEFAQRPMFTASIIFWGLFIAHTDWDKKSDHK